jgi:hypothetical protein
VNVSFLQRQSVRLSCSFDNCSFGHLTSGGCNRIRWDERQSIWGPQVGTFGAAVNSNSQQNIGLLPPIGPPSSTGLQLERAGKLRADWDGVKNGLSRFTPSIPSPECGRDPGNGNRPPSSPRVLQFVKVVCVFCSPGRRSCTMRARRSTSSASRPRCGVT